MKFSGRRGRRIGGKVSFGASAVLIGLAASTAAAAQTYGARVDAALAPFTAAGQAPGCAVAASQNGRTLVSRTFGTANLEHQVPVTAETVFEAGSAAKQFTAAAILLLVQDGKLRLDDDVRKHVPELPDYGEVITIDHLLGHTSGIRDYALLRRLVGPEFSEHHTIADIVHLAIRQRSLAFEPGSAYGYSNTGYVLLAEIVGRVTDSTLAEFSRTRLFEPLGMSATRWRDDFRRTVPRRATAYSRSGEDWLQFMPTEHVYGPGALLTTTGDLLKWNEALNTGRLGRGIAEAMQQEGRLETGRPTGYGRGLFVRLHEGRPELSHAGGMGGYRAWTGRFPQSGLSVAVLCNAATIPVDSLAYAVADVFLPPAQRGAESPATYALTADEAARLSGLFVEPATGWPLEIQNAPDRLRAENGGLDAVSANRLRREGWGEIQFEGVDRLRLQRVRGQESTYVRAETRPATPAELARAAGVFASDEVGVRYELVPVGDALRVRRFDRPQFGFTLRRIAPDTFYGAGLTVRLSSGVGPSEAFDLIVPPMTRLRFTRQGAVRAPSPPTPGNGD